MLHVDWKDVDNTLQTKKGILKELGVVDAEGISLLKLAISPEYEFTVYVPAKQGCNHVF